VEAHPAASTVPRAPVLANVFLTAVVGAGLALTTSRYASFDAAAYYLEALLVAGGAAPYVDFVENKSPGIFYLLALPARVFGWDPVGAVLLFRALELAWLALLDRILAAVAVRPAARRLALAVGYAAYLACFATTWETVYTELPEAALATLAILLLATGRGGPFAIGLALGVATLMRQTALLQAAGLVLLVLLEPGRARARVQSAVVLGAGTAVPLAGIVAVAAGQGWLEAWVVQAYAWNYRYVAAFDPLWTRLLPTLGQLARNDFLLPFGLAVAVRPFLGGLADRATRILGVWCLVGLVEASASGVLYRHHFVPWLGALVALFGETLERLLRLPRPRVRVGALAAASVLAVHVMAGNVRSAARLHVTDREQLQPIAAWIRAHTAPGDRILVWGFAPQLYLLAERRPASQHTHHLLLTNAERRFLPLDAGFVRDFRADLAATPPAVVVVLSDEPLGPYFGARLADYRLLDARLGPGGRIRVLARRSRTQRPPA